VPARIQGPFRCSSTPECSHAVRGSAVSIPQCRELALQQREAAEQDERVQEIAFERVAEEGKGRSVAGDQSCECPGIMLSSAQTPKLVTTKNSTELASAAPAIVSAETALLQTTDRCRTISAKQP